jgi:hypothetical protein
MMAMFKTMQQVLQQLLVSNQEIFSPIMSTTLAFDHDHHHAPAFSLSPDFPLVYTNMTEESHEL